MKLICYLSLGSPNIPHSIDIANHYVASGCDTIEVDFPAEDPYLDSPYIQSRMKEALSACNDYQKYMDAIVQIKKNQPKASFIVLIYEKTIKTIGIDRFIDFCQQNHLYDIICVGNEYPEVREYLMKSKLKVSTFIRYHLPEEDILVAKEANGFIYLQAKPSDQMHQEYQSLKTIIPYLRKRSISNPIYCGVGVSTPEDVKMVKDAGGDGVFIGSTVLKLHHDLPELKTMIQALKSQT